MDHKTVDTERAPRPIAPYSPAVVVCATKLVFCSGQIPLDPATQAMVAGDIRVQTRRVMDNLKAVLEAAGSSLERVVRTTIFLTSLADFAAVNEIYASYFTGERPARSTVGVAALPRGADVEIDAIATAP
jgi:2-iminobutanoate/2-iminopropanoate deaminase